MPGFKANVQEPVPKDDAHDRSDTGGDVMSCRGNISVEQRRRHGPPNRSRLFALATMDAKGNWRANLAQVEEGVKQSLGLATREALELVENVDDRDAVDRRSLHALHRHRQIASRRKR